MKFIVILISLHLLVTTYYIECNRPIGRKVIKGSSVHNRLHVKQYKNWEEDDRLRYFVKITWNIKAEHMRIKDEEEIGQCEKQQLYYKCTGIVVGPGWVITAASCFQPKIRQLKKERGTALVFPLPTCQLKALYQTRIADQIYIHPDYVENSRKGDPDVALVQLTEIFDLSQSSNKYVILARLAKNIPYSMYTKRNNMRDCLVFSYGEDAFQAKQPFSNDLSAYDVRAAGPKYCEIMQRRLGEPWVIEKTIMAPWASDETNMFDRFFICTTPYRWYDDGNRTELAELENSYGCLGAVGGALTCRGDEPHVIVGVQSQQFGPYYCEDVKSYSTFTSLGHWRVHNWIAKHIPNIGLLESLADTQYAYRYDSRGMPIYDNTTSAHDKSSTAMVSTSVGLILSLALSVTAFTF